MFQVVAVLILALVAPQQLLACGCDTRGVIIEKSFHQSVHDCVEYLHIPKERLTEYYANEFPSDHETKCLLYCVGVDLGWWNSTCGLQKPSMVSYFQPVPGDNHYEKRTNECLDRRVGPIQSPTSCCQAYETFQCYFQEFGNLVTCPQYVRLTKLQATQAALDCLTILRYPEELLQVYASGKVEDCPETRCLYHCIDLRTGLYTPENGICLSRFFVRDASCNDLRYLSKETKACRDRIRQSGCDKCSEVYQTHQECLAGLGEDGYTAGIIVKAAELALANRGICCAHRVEENTCYKHPVTYAPYTTPPCPSAYHPTHPPHHVYVPHHPTSELQHCSVCNDQLPPPPNHYHFPGDSLVPSEVSHSTTSAQSTFGRYGSIDQVYNKPLIRGYSHNAHSLRCNKCSRHS